MSKFYNVKNIDPTKTYHFIIAEKNHGKNHSKRG